MDEQLQDLVNRTADRLGLQQYELARHSIFRQTNTFHETVYILNMEWFPNHVQESGENFNPAGTAVVEVDIHSHQVRQLIFSEGVTFEENKNLPSSDKEDAIEWVEKMTGLEFGRQFRLVDEQADTLYFQAAVDNVPVYPSGTIELRFDEEGNLILFSVDGTFPDEEHIRWEPFNLTTDKTGQTAEEQVKLMEIPLEEETRWLPVYGLNTVFLTNDASRTISFEEVEKHLTYVGKDTLLEWNQPAEEEFAEEEVDFSLEVTEKQALENEMDPDTQPLTETDQAKAVEEAVYFLQRVYPEGSGTWRLAGIYRQNGYIFADLKGAETTNKVVERKIRLILDKDDLHAVSYLDNQVIVDIFQQFEPAEQTRLSTEESYQKLKDHVDVTPVYVYEASQEKYILCGKIASDYGVDAVTGEVISLNEL
ncbi:hypothetical protein ACFOGI_13190 [Virgibacillus xinjiangensis]|uniref:PepSY domain-containing protein n=1 Tax=Virgibacillus xinjiangensis TaxID=393090 RepID=A0ABV7CXH4_9BACI